MFSSQLTYRKHESHSINDIQMLFHRFFLPYFKYTSSNSGQINLHNQKTQNENILNYKTTFCNHAFKDTVNK